MTMDRLSPEELKHLLDKSPRINEFDGVMVICRRDGKWGVVDTDGNVRVPFGKYDIIDPFFMGLARVKIGELASLRGNHGKFHWGIIDLSGKEVVPVKYTELYEFSLNKRTRIRVGIDAEYHYLYLRDIAPAPYNSGKYNEGINKKQLHAQ